MIRAVLEEDAGSFSLTVSGHADSAPRGEDLICAAVSALVYGLWGFSEELEKKGLALPQSKRDLGPGQAQICLCPVPQTRQQTGGAFALTAQILRQLGSHFPENIQFTEKRRTNNDN